ncbi:hypothetical protein JKA74_03680 [Marivirga sp. S37H4]|uniref:Uncharacterized protein n=1 Tax=Marivirga aurantiaca TaxID=2802615 RepID=A0A934WWB4_9BACT|nr:hypothetical protein [Marivirga aurantiaca]MBK6264127.1 hypothetical protein [Marivirga aurantiaca]
MENQEQKIVVVKQKSMGLTIILSFLFGPLGMLYSTIIGGVVMFVISVLVGIFTLGLGLIITWPIGVIWAALATNNHNKRIMNNSINNQ